MNTHTVPNVPLPVMSITQPGQLTISQSQILAASRLPLLPGSAGQPGALYQQPQPFVSYPHTHILQQGEGYTEALKQL